MNVQEFTALDQDRKLFFHFYVLRNVESADILREWVMKFTKRTFESKRRLTLAWRIN